MYKPENNGIYRVQLRLSSPLCTLHYIYTYTHVRYVCRAGKHAEQIGSATRVHHYCNSRPRNCCAALEQWQGRLHLDCNAPLLHETRRVRSIIISHCLLSCTSVVMHFVFFTIVLLASISENHTLLTKMNSSRIGNRTACVSHYFLHLL